MEEENDDTTWMFRTFSKSQNPQAAESNHKHIKISIPDENSQRNEENLNDFMQNIE